jgi:ComF family protein
MIPGRLKSIQQWLFPGICLLCSERIAASNEFCDACEASLPRLYNGCEQCAVPLEEAGATQHRCGACQQHPPVFRRALAPFVYAAPIDRLIQDLKYQQRLETARLLGVRLADYVTSRDPEIDVIVPVPLHAKRLRERGYNQSLEIARPVAEQLGLRLDYQSAQRTRATPPQTSLPPKARQRNVRNAFKVTGSFKGARVAVLDDVMTTGHTVNAFATCLKKTGAKSIEVWVVARA